MSRPNKRIPTKQNSAFYWKINHLRAVLEIFSILVSKVESEIFLVTSTLKIRPSTSTLKIRVNFEHCSHVESCSMTHSSRLYNPCLSAKSKLKFLSDHFQQRQQQEQLLARLSARFFSNTWKLHGNCSIQKNISRMHAETRLLTIAYCFYSSTSSII